MTTTPRSLTWNLNPNTNLTKGVVWQGKVAVSGSPVTATIDPNPHAVFTIVSISSYVTIHQPPGGGGGRFPAIKTPLNPNGTRALPGTPEVTSELVQRVLGSGPLTASLDESIVVEVNADATVGIGKLPNTATTQGTNEFAGTLHILGLGAAVTVPLTLDLCQATTNLVAFRSSDPKTLIIDATSTSVFPPSLQYGAPPTQVTLAPPGVSNANPLTFWLQQWGGQLDTGLNSFGSYNLLSGPAPVGFPYPYVPCSL